MHPSEYKVPIIVVLKNALLERGWKVLAYGVVENESGEVREWTHPRHEAPITLIAAYWKQETWDYEERKL
jgi:hypothetical protein